MGSKDTMPNEYIATIRQLIDRSLDLIEQGRIDDVSIGYTRSTAVATNHIRIKFDSYIETEEDEEKKSEDE